MYVGGYEIVMALWFGKCLRLAKETGGDIAHVSLLQLVVLATHFVNADVFECGYYGFYVEAHSDESIDELLVVSVVSASILACAS